MQIQTYNAELIFSSEEGRLAVVRVLEDERDAFNACSKVCFAQEKLPNTVELHHLFYRGYRREKPGIQSTILIKARMAVHAAYKTAKSNKHKLEKPIVKRRLSMRLDCRSFSYSGLSVSVIGPQKSKRIKALVKTYAKLEELRQKFDFGDPLIFERGGRIFISIPFRVDEPTKKEGRAIGIDLGVRVNVATSDGQLITDKAFNGRKRQLRFLKRRLQARATKSAKRHLVRLRRKEVNANKDFTHRLVDKVMQSDAVAFVVEDLSGLKHKRKSSNRLSQVPFHIFKQVLTFKAARQGKTVSEVSPAFTSQTNCLTGKKEGLRKGRRFYTPCGLILDSDLNAAVNILHKTNHPRSRLIPLAGQAICQLANRRLDRQAHSFRCGQLTLPRILGH